MAKSLNSLIWSSALKSDRKLLLLALAYHANGDGVTFPGVPLLARETGLTTRGVEKILNALVMSKVLVVVERGNGRGNTNKYRIATSVLGRTNTECGSGFVETENPEQETAEPSVNPEPDSGNDLNPEPETPNGVRGIEINPESGSGLQAAELTRNPERSACAYKEQPLKVLKKYKTSTNVLGANAPTEAEVIWKKGVALLETGGMAAAAARSLLGKLAKDHGKEQLARAIETVEGANPASPREYLVKVLQNIKNGVKGNEYAEERKRSAQRDLARFRTDWKAKLRAARDGRAEVGQKQPA
jgi:hypothetical protein